MSEEKKPYWLLVNGHSACVSRLTMDVIMGCTTTSLKVAEDWKTRLLAVHPDAQVEIREGRCISSWNPEDKPWS